MDQLASTSTLGLRLYIDILHETMKFSAIAAESNIVERHLGRLRQKPETRTAMMTGRRLRPLAREQAKFPWPVDAELQIDAIDNLLLERDVRGIWNRWSFSAAMTLKQISALDLNPPAVYSSDDWGEVLFAERFYAAALSSSAEGYNNEGTRKAYLLCYRVLSRMLASLKTRWAAYLAMRKSSNIVMARWNKATIEEKRGQEMCEFVSAVRHFETLFACLELRKDDRDVAFNILVNASGMNRKNEFEKVCQILGSDHRTIINEVITENRQYLVNGDEINLKTWMDEMNSKPKKIKTPGPIGALLAITLAFAVSSAAPEMRPQPTSDGAVYQLADMKPLTYTMQKTLSVPAQTLLA